MTDDSVKRGRGRPKKVKAHDIDAIINKVRNEEQRFAAKCADSLGSLFKVIFDLANDDKAPIKDQVKAVDYCIKFAQTFLEENQDGEKGESKPKDGVKPKAPLISLSSSD